MQSCWYLILSIDYFWFTKMLLIDLYLFCIQVYFHMFKNQTLFNVINSIKLGPQTWEENMMDRICRQYPWIFGEFHGIAPPKTTDDSGSNFGPSTFVVCSCQVICTSASCYAKLMRRTVSRIGSVKSSLRFEGKICKVALYLHRLTKSWFKNADWFLNSTNLHQHMDMQSL